MHRRILLSSCAFSAALAGALLGCGNPPPGGKAHTPMTAKGGPAVASGEGISITADEFKARLDEQSPFIRARYTTLDRKKEFLENLLRFELLAKEAERRGIANDPEVQNTLKKVMVQKLIRQEFDEVEGAKALPDTELKKYYDEHLDDYVKPERVRVSHIYFKAEKGSPDYAKKVTEAKKLLATIQGEEKQKPTTFSDKARDLSEDPASKAVGGDLTYKSKADLEKQYSLQMAEAAMGLKDIGQLSEVVETPNGVHLVKLTGRQAALDRPFDQVKPQIANRLYREKREKEFNEYVKKLRADAKVNVNDAELDRVAVQGGPSPMAGVMPGMPPPPGSPSPGGAPPQSLLGGSGAGMGGPPPNLARPPGAPQPMQPVPAPISPSAKPSPIQQ